MIDSWVAACEPRPGSSGDPAGTSGTDGIEDRAAGTNGVGRQLLNAFGSKDYAREELVAEMGSAFPCASLGIEPTVRHADYVGAWLSLCRAAHKASNREVAVM